MSLARPIAAIFLCYSLALPGFAQTQGITLDDGHGLLHDLTRPYHGRPVASISFADSGRIEQLLRAGNLYLYLRDAIALALENNLDIEVARLQPKLALTNLQRAGAGQLLRNFSSSLAQGPSSATLGVLGGANALGNSGVAGGGTSNSGVLSGLSVQLAGSTIPNVDPVLFVSGQFQHQTQIQASTVVTGTTSLVTQYKNLVYGVQEGWWTGTTVQAGLSSIFGYNQNAPTLLYNPFDTGTLSVNVTQNFLQGFGLKVNKRSLIQARNNLHASDLTFKQQVMATVANVVNLYWDLVTYNDDLKVKQQTLQLNTTLYNDNRRRAELGAIAPIDIIAAEAEMKSSQQDVITQESQVLQQEQILKSVITRAGLDSPAIASARIIPTDHATVPETEPVIPVQDLVAEAVQKRPEIEQNQITLENARLSMLGTKNALLPTLSATAGLSNAGQGGSVSNIPQPVYGPLGNITGYRQLTPTDVNAYFLGGYGTALGQIFRRNFPNYSLQFTLTMQLRNRSAQADYITDELNYRQSEIQDRQLRNNIKLNVMNSWTAMRQARAAYETAVVARKLYDETLAGTRRKYELGTATITDVMIAQRDSTARQLSEVDARNQYTHARTNLEQTLGSILETYNVSVDEAKNGVVGRAPDLVPAVPPRQ
jgi:outer membrane protein TolC